VEEVAEVLRVMKWLLALPAEEEVLLDTIAEGLLERFGVESESVRPRLEAVQDEAGLDGAIHRGVRGAAVSVESAAHRSADGPRGYAMVHPESVVLSSLQDST
jgi:hypothetical protein